MVIKDLFELIERSTGKFPREALLEIIRLKEESIPVLLETLSKVRDNPEKYTMDLEYLGHILATYLLVHFKVKEAYPIIIDLFSLKDELSDELFGDMLLEDGGRILASICGGDIEPIKKLIENPKVHESVREQGVQAFTIIVHNGLKQREEIFDYYSKLINSKLIDNKKTVITAIIGSCNELYPEELYKDITKAFKENRVNSRQISLAEIDETLKRSKNEVIQDLQYNPYIDLIENAIAELGRWGSLYLKESETED